MNNLPFEKEDGRRKWQCFICGYMFTKFDEFNEHIEKKHDEGREYIKCPLERCQACVRDLNMHFKCKHPGNPIPKNCQTKAMVWKDKSPKTGKLTTKKSKFKKGYFPSQKNQKNIHYRSGMEKSLYEAIEKIPEIIAYKEEPFSVQYSFEGSPHEYFPDLIVTFDDGHSEIWEVKPGKQTSLAVNHAKWAACQQYCESRGMGFVVMTEVGLGKLQNKARQTGDN